jgi:hypothetical protein
VATATLINFWRIDAMTPQRLDWKSGLISLVLKNVGVSTGVAILLASSSAFAWNNNQTPATSQSQQDRNTPIAADVQVETSPQGSKPASETSNQPRFSCQFLNGQYTVMYSPESQPGQSYAWATPSTLGGGWTEERRCNEITRRLEFYRPDGLLEMQTSVENNYNIVCVTTQKEPACRIVLTVPPGQDPQSTRDRVFENLTIADGGQDTEAVNTFVGGDSNSQLLNQVLNQGLSSLGIGNSSIRRSGNINLRPFLDPGDGGTGTKLRRGMPTRPNPRLNPEGFR